MAQPRIYESTVPHPDREKEMLWRFIVVPARVIPETASHSAPAVLSALELTKISRVSPTRLPFMVAVLLMPERPEDFKSRVEGFARDWADKDRQSLPEESREALELAEQVVFSRLVPFEGSPCCQESFGSLVARVTGGSDNDGAFLVGSGERRLITVVGEDGVLIGGPHASIVNSNIWDKILRWLRGL